MSLDDVHATTTATQRERASGSSRASSPTALREALVWLAFFGSLIALFGSSLREHMLLSADPRIANDDALMQIFPFFRYEDRELFPNDYIGNYSLACFPLGYRLLYTIAAHLDITVQVSKVVPYVGLLITVFCIAACAHRFGGKAGAWVAAALCLGSEFYLWRMAGGLPRAFCLPFLASAAAALVYGRTLTLACLVPLAAAFYPVAAVMMGMALSLVLLALPAASRGSAATWSLRKRIATLALSAAVSAIVLLPTSAGLREYGSLIRPTDASFPEAGYEGRYGPDSRPPFAGFFESVPAAVANALRGGGKPWVEPAHAWATDKRRRWLNGAILIAAAVGWIGFIRTRHEARRFLMLGAAALIGHTIAEPTAPYFYLPPRYVLYPIPVLATPMIATAAAGYLVGVRRWVGSAWAVPSAITLAAVPLLVAFGGSGTASRGLKKVGRHAEVFSAIESLPKDVLIAGWPRGLVDSIPYVARRQALMTFETHLAFHSEYTSEMRRRMRAFIEAYFGTKPGPLLELHRRYGVTHVIVQRAHFEGSPPKYFQPFKEAIATAAERGAGNYEVLRQAERGRSLEGGRIVLIDLRTMQVNTDVTAGGRAPRAASP